MNPTLEFIGKAAATFDVCVISFIVGLVVTLLLAGRVRKWWKLPEGHWAAHAALLAGAIITTQLALTLAKVVWTWNH